MVVLGRSPAAQRREPKVRYTLRAMGSSDRQSGLMRNLGRFFGHIVAGARSDPSRQEVSRQVEECQVDTPAGKVTLRRTTVEEIEIRKDAHIAGDHEP